MTPTNTIPDIKDIKPPIDIPTGTEWLWPVLAALALATVAFVVWQMWRTSRLNVPAEPLVPAHIRAKQRLQKALEIIGQPKEFCILVSDTVRLYLEERFAFHAPERTTEEFLRELSATNLLTEEQKESLGRFLENCDLVKFAKYEPGENELRELHSSAVRLVEETEPAENSNGESRPPVQPPLTHK
ncbi:MAG TPA: hypothetical protein VMF08_18355 [Candidatus Sulfotelmatobacter sp.]|nr:hypothetical protein [Candidatus Sulfotelmatobacter sp.]